MCCGLGAGFEAFNNPLIPDHYRSLWFDSCCLLLLLLLLLLLHIRNLIKAGYVVLVSVLTVCY